MKNIVIIYTGMNMGGAQKVILDLLLNVKDTYNPILICDSGELVSEIRQAGIKVYIVPLKRKTIKNIFLSLRQVLKILKNEDIQLIHSHHRYTSTLCNIIKPLHRLPVIHSEHSVYSNKNNICIRGKYNVAVSEKVKKNLVAIGFKEECIKIIYNGVEIPQNLNKTNLLNNELNISDDYILIGVLARLVEGKGHIFLLNTLSEYLLSHNKKIKLIFIGDGPQKPLISKYIKDLGIENYVDLLGNRRDIQELIQCIDFFVLPSFFEGLPISILEIMAQGKIMIATNVGGNSEIIDNGQNGFLVDPNDKQQLLDAIIYCINNFDKLEELKKNAKTTIISKFSKEMMVKQYLDLYDSLI